MRAIGVTLLAMTMMASGAFAEALPPGKPANVKQAKIETGGIVVLSVIGLVGVGVAAVLATNGNVPLGTFAVATR